MAEERPFQIVPITDVLDTENVMQWPQMDFRTLRCPRCKFQLQHPFAAPTRKGRDNYEATGRGWEGRGDLLIINMDGECGHDWEVCIGFHKGHSAIFVRYDPTQVPEIEPPEEEQESTTSPPPPPPPL